MFRQVFSRSSATVALVNLGLSQVNFTVPTFRRFGPLLSDVCFRRQLCSVLAINSGLHCPSCQSVGQLVLYRGYADNTRRSRSSAIYIVATFIFMVGAAYAGVPLYRMICQVSSYISTCFYSLYV